MTEPTDDVDRKLEQIRQGLEAEHGRTIDFYGDDIRLQWNPESRKKAWNGLIQHAQDFVDTGQLDSQENDYKVEIGRKLKGAREAVLIGADDWASLVKGGLAGNLIYSIQQARLRDWINESPDDAWRALQAIWTRDDVPVSERIRAFCEFLPSAQISGPGTRTTVASVFLMGLDVYQHPPFRITLFNSAYNRTGYGLPDKDGDEAVLYEHALGFLDRLIDEAAARGLNLRHRLDAQSLVWAIRNAGDEPVEPDEPVASEPDDYIPPQPDLKTLSEELLLPLHFLEEINVLLKEKKQVIFQGPPGTGKTYVAQKLAECLAGSEERVTLVQFHPSYAYEDFVQGFRPTLASDGQPRFVLRDGPLLSAAERSRKEPDKDHFLVIDEINRGNLAKVFGELYFLLEYRNKKMRLQYQTENEDGFSLPKNLYIIGTMNTADRSIALVDLALRRRFYFVQFHPDDEPVKSLLREWLERNAEGMIWVADIVDRANRKLKEDRHVAIGPSYFMGTDDRGEALVRDEDGVRRIWEHSVIPYIEEHLFGNLDGLDEWKFDALRKKADGSGGEEDSKAEMGNGAETEASAAQ